MKPVKAYMYSEEAPEGRMFDADQLSELGPEWVDSPSKIGGETKATDLDDRIAAFVEDGAKWKTEDLRDLAVALGAPEEKAAEMNKTALSEGINKALARRADVAANGANVVAENG